MSIQTPNMNLAVPGVGTEGSPAYAIEINGDLSILDQHDHSQGNGVQITPSGININAALTLNNNSLTNVAGVSLKAQSGTPSTLGTIYESGVDLYYVDGSGNNVRITQSGGVAGSPGSISNLNSPASAAYVSISSTFVWQSGANIAANLDAGSLLMRNLSPNSTYALTLSPPANLGANYSVTLPALPSANNTFLTMSTAGVIGAAITVDNSTLEIASATTLRIKDLGVSTAKIAANAVTRPKLAAVGQQLSSSCGSASSSSSSYADITNLSVTITTSGRPVFVAMIPDGASIASIASDAPTGITTYTIGAIQFVRASTSIAQFGIQLANNTNASASNTSALFTIDPVAAGTYTYKAQFKINNGVPNALLVSNYALIAYEL